MKTKRTPVSKLLVTCVIFTLLLSSLSGCARKKEAPFFGIQYGDSSSRVKSIMGKPDDFDDNRLSFNYEYEVSFLGDEGLLDIHFELDMVESMYFYYSSMDEYEVYGYAKKITEHYLKKYGEPDYTYGELDNISTNDASQIRYSWELEDGAVLLIEIYFKAPTYFESMQTPHSIWVKVYH